ncbi:FkbM family methyltransferase [Desulfovibrio sp. OttesenSCG-928-G11]|nr:FkbM family methyltransferase [Desulfovibrio sp. OttesenSCG-928-G11]
MNSNSSVSNLASTILYYDFLFFASIKECGTQDGISYVKLYNGDILFGYSKDGGYYQPIFEKYADDFAKLNLTQDGYPAAFDALISYHYENAAPILKTNFLPYSGTVLDIGCRACHFAVKASHIADKIFCIDPTDFSEKYFNLHISNNSLNNCQFIKQAVSEKCEVKRFFSGSAGGSFSGFIESTKNKSGDIVVSTDMHKIKKEILTTTVDDLVNEYQIASIDMIILQINGYEYNALIGAMNTLKNIPPSIIFVTTFQNDRHSTTPQRGKIFNLLDSIGYTPIIRTETVDVYSHAKGTKITGVYNYAVDTATTAICDYSKREENNIFFNMAQKLRTKLRYWK